MFLPLQIGHTSGGVTSSSALVDTGCFATLPLISEEVWNRLPHRPSLSHSAVRLTSAGSKPLLTLGTTPRPITFTMRNHITGSTVTYRSQAYVVRNLSSPTIMGYHDLIRLDATISPTHKQFLVRLKTGRTVLFDLTPKPVTPMAGFIQKGTLIPAYSERCVSLVFPAALPDQEVIILPGEEFSISQQQPNISVSGVVDRVRQDRTCRALISNPSSEDIHLQRGHLIGVVETLDAYHLRHADDSKYVAAIKTTSQFQGRTQTELKRENFVSPTTQQQLRDRIWNDCNFTDPATPLTPSEKASMVTTMAQHREALSLDYDEVGLCDKVTLTIPTSGPPIRQKVRPLGPHLRESLDLQLERWQSQKVCRPSQSPWASPILAVPKKNGGVRFCVDYRRLNAVTETDARPISNVEDRLACLSAKKDSIRYMVSLDVAEAYHSIRIADKDIPKTAFITPRGLFEMTRAPFGLASMPSVFHTVVRLFEARLKEIAPADAEYVFIYFDDILITAQNFDDARRRLSLVLSVLQYLGLKCQPKKTVFAKDQIKWLGMTITSEAMRPDQDRVKALVEWNKPATHKELHSLFALLSTFRRFIPNFAARTNAMRGALKRDTSTCRTE